MQFSLCYLVRRLLLCVLSCYSISLVAGEIDLAEVHRRGDAVQHITAQGFGQDDAHTALAPPADDQHKWFISVLTQPGCTPCKLLQRHFREATELSAWAAPLDTQRSWSHYREYDTADETQTWRWKNIAVTAYPTILLQPPRNGKYGDPATVILQKTGYDGDPAKLAAQLRAAVLKQVQSNRAAHQGAGESAATNRPALTPPFTPPSLPSVEPSTPTDIPSPSVIPTSVDPDAQPSPREPTAPTQPSGVYPQHPEAVVVVDKFADSVADDTSFNRIRAVLQRLQSDRPGLTIRVLDVRDAAGYPVDRRELPAVITTSEGRIETKLDRSLLPILAADPPPFPWHALLALLTTGFSWAGFAALAVWGIAMIRRIRQARGKQLLLDEQTATKLRELLEKLGNR